MHPWLSHLPSPSELTFQNSPKLIPAGCKEAGKVLCVPLESNSKNASAPTPHTHTLLVETHKSLLFFQSTGFLQPPRARPGPLPAIGVPPSPRAWYPCWSWGEQSQTHQFRPPPGGTPSTNRILFKSGKQGPFPLQQQRKGGGIMKNKSDELAAAFSDNKSVLG